MLKILHARLQHYVNQELPDVQAGFRKGRGTRDPIADIHWIIERERELKKKKHRQTNTYHRQTNIIDYTKAFNCVDHNKLWKALRDRNTRPSYLSPVKPVCISRINS